MTSGYLLDTNAVSALRHGREDRFVAAVIKPLDPDMLFLSVLTLGELRRGLINKKRKLPTGSTALARWINELEEVYANRLIPIDAKIARVWGEITADRSRPAVDTLLAATAIVHNLTLVTRNEIDFNDLPVKLLNPWKP
jgi:toxin FitB